jgi:manganese/iron transport system substrate-binding protein
MNFLQVYFGDRSLLRSRVKRAIGLTSVTLVGIAGCSSGVQTSEKSATAQNAENPPLVVATSSVICDLTEQIAGETIDLKCTIEAGQDPHTYQAKPDDRKNIDTAKLIFYGGYNFDTSMVKLIDASSNSADKIAVHEKAVPKPLMGEHEHEHEGKNKEEKHEHEHEGKNKEEKHEHEEGEGEKPDPHVWHDVRNGIAMVEVITNALVELEPENAKLYRENAAKITTELESIDSWIKQEIGTIPASQRKLVTTHDALGYFANAYGLEIEGALQGLSTEQEATATRVGELVKEIKKTNVPTIFAETTSTPKLINAVAKEAKVKLSERDLYADGLGEEGSDGETYQKMLIANTKTIVEGLGGKYSPFKTN